MRPALLLIALPVISGLLHGQTATSVEPQLVHVHGVTSDFAGAVVPGTTIVFQQGSVAKATISDSNGNYAVDLSPGLYTMTAKADERKYRGALGGEFRPFFRLGTVFDVRLDTTFVPVRNNCDIVVMGKSGAPASEQEWRAAAKSMCPGTELLATPSADGTAFEIYVHWEHRIKEGERLVYKGENGVPVLVRYNLLSLQANQVAYDPRKRTMRADGNVLFTSDSGTPTRIESVKLKIENGRATILQ